VLDRDVQSVEEEAVLISERTVLARSIMESKHHRSVRR